jgi:hypothetical protein
VATDWNLGCQGQLPPVHGQIIDTTDDLAQRDTALSRLDDRELLAELLDRTLEALRADTAAVLLLDFSSGQLIATAAACHAIPCQSATSYRSQEEKSGHPADTAQSAPMKRQGRRRCTGFPRRLPGCWAAGRLASLAVWLWGGAAGLVASGEQGEKRADQKPFLSTVPELAVVFNGVPGAPSGAAAADVTSGL